MMRKSNFIRRTEGAAAIIIACSLFVFIGVASLAIDVGQLHTVRNQLQNVADAAALAGVSQLIRDQGGVAVWYSDQAQAAALKVAQDQGALDGLPKVADGARNDLTIHFGAWDPHVADRNLAWTDRGTSVGSTSDANAMKITITRAAGTIFGPVTSLFAQALGSPTSTVSASAIAYLDFSYSATVQVPLALPTSILSASNGRSGWFASLFGPGDAVASTHKTLVFKDTGGRYVNTAVNNNPTLDSTVPYIFTVNSGDSVPGTIWSYLEGIYTSGSTTKVGELKVNQQLYTRSEFKYGIQYIGPIFQRLQYAYNYKTTGNKNTAPAAGTAWPVTLPVYAMTKVASQPRKAGFLSLARLLAPFWPSEAYACYTVPPPAAILNTFVNASITGVTYNGSSDDGNYTYPHTMKDKYTNNLSVTYTDKKDFLTNYPNSTWNANTVTIQNVYDASTVSPLGSVSGGPSSQSVNPSAPTHVGAYATSYPRIVK